MSNSFDNGAMVEFVSAVRELASGKNEDKRYLTGTVSHTDLDGTVWVNVAGGVSAMPVSRSTASYSPGDVVSFSIENGVASMGGNVTDPAAGGDTVLHVTKQVDIVENHVERIERVKADRVETDILNAAVADIETAMIGKADVDDLTAAEARIGNLEADHVSTTDLQATNARVGTIEADYLKAADMQAETARVDNLLAGKATVNDLNAATGRITQLESADARITGRLEAAEADIDDLEAEDARITNLVAGKASINDLNAATGRITVLESTKANISDIEANYITADDIEATYMHANMSNSDVAWIQNGVIANGAISSAMINDVSANKLTAGTINGSVINVTNLTADNITAGTLNGQRIGTGSLSLDKLSEAVYTEAEVDAKLSDMQAEIDGAIETWTGTEVPTLNNAPASAWTTTSDRDKHVGDVYFNTTSGYNYRFTKSGSTYSWLQIKDTDITNALQRIQTAEGKITTFDSDISTLKTDTGELKTKTQSLETSLGDKVDTTTFNELEDTVDGHSQTISQHTTAISQKADTSTVNQVTNRVSKNEQDISGINTTIGQLQTTVAGKADGSTVTTISNKLNTVETTVNGHTETLSSVQSTLSTKADNSTVATLRSEYNETKTTVSGHETRLSATESVANGVRADFDNLEIGGRNLLRFTGHPTYAGDVYNAANREKGWCRWTAAATISRTSDGIRYTNNSESSNPSGFCIPFVFDDAAVGGEDYVLSFDYKSNYSSLGKLFLLKKTGGNTPTSSEVPIEVSEDSWKHFSQVLRWPSTQGYVTYALLIPYYAGKDRYLEIKDGTAKLERGNKATDWTPAPEDLETEVTSLKTDYATYKQTTTEALSEIGTTYATKTELGTETSNRQTAIQQLNNTISSKANASDVYTKTDVNGLISTEVSNRNSAIQQSAESITQTVSSTYATKTELSEAAASAEVTRSDSGKREIVTEDAAELPLLTLTAYGECSQDGTPTPDAPVDIQAVSWKNLVDWKVGTFGANELIVILDADVYTMSAKSALSTGAWYIRATDINGVLLTKQELSLDGWNEASSAAGIYYGAANNGSFTFAVPRKATVEIGKLNSDSTIPAQLERGGTASQYVPYGCIAVKTKSKNLFNPSGMQATETKNNVTFTNNGDGSFSVSSSGNASASTSFLLAKVAARKEIEAAIADGGTFTISCDKASYDGNKFNISVAYTEPGSSTTKWITTNTTVPSGCTVTNCSLYISSGNAPTAVTNAHIQIERGSTATQYEPYRESVAYIDLQGEELYGLSDGTQEVLTMDASGHVTIEKHTRKLDWNDVVNFNSNSTRVATYTNANTDIVVPAASEMPVLLATHLTPHIWSGTTIPGTSFINPSNGAIGWNFSPGVASTLAELKTLYPGAYSIHLLKEPKTIDLGYIDPPTTFDGGTVHVDAEIQPVIDASWWTKAGYETGKAYNDGNGSADLAALTERVTTNETAIEQTNTQVALKANSSDVYTKTQADGKVSEAITSAKAEIKVTTDGITSEVEKKTDKATIISTIRQSAETVKIKASQVEIDGTAIFTAISDDVDDAITDKGYQTASQVNTAITSKGYQTASQVDTAITSKGYATTGQAQGYANTAEQNAKAAIPTDISDLNNDTGFITSDDVPTKVSELTNDSGFQTSSQVNTAITSKGYQTSSQVESAIISKGYATTTQVGTAKSEAISAAASDATSKANAAQTAATNAANQATDTKLQSYSTTSQMNTAIGNAVDAIEVGGRNLLKWTAEPTQTSTSWNRDPASIDSWSRWNTYWNTERTDYGIKGTLVLNGASTASGFVVPLVTENAAIGGVDYVLSFDYRTNASTTGSIYLLCASGGNALAASRPLVVSETEWQHFSAVLNWPSTEGKVTRGLLIPYFNQDGTWLEIHDGSIKLEKGNKATDWSPAPEDVEQNAKNYADQAASAAVAPLATKTYTGVIGTANDLNNASLYFAKIHPADYNGTWRIKLRVNVTAPTTYQQVIDFTLSGRQSVYMSYDDVVSRSTAAGAIYYINLYRALQAGIAAKAGHALGFGLRSSTNPTNASYARTVEVQVLEAVNCEVELLDTAVKYGSLPSYSTSNYGTHATSGTGAAVNEFNVWNNGQNASNNSNTYDRTTYAQNVKASSDTYVGTHIIVGDSSGYRNLAAGKTFDLSYPILYYATAASTTIASGSTANNHYLNIPGISFSVNGTVESGAAYKTLYLKGTISGNIFTIAASPFMTTAEPTNANGYFYIPLGVMSSATAGRFVSSSDLYAFIDGKFRQVTPTEIVATQCVYYRSKQSGTFADAYKPTAWVTQSTDKYNANTSTANGWSTKVTPIAASKDADSSGKYLYLYTCEQRKRLDGTVEHTDILLDDSTTIIDGGNIITGSVAANKLEVYDATIQKIRADAIDTASITIGQDQVDGLDETLDELIPTSLSQLANDVGYVDASFMPDEIPVANINGQLTVDKIDVDSLRAALLQVASLLIGQESGCHIEASGQRMSFKDGKGNEVAYIAVDANGKSTFYMTRSMVVEDMQFGSGLWKWYKRGNNNMSLKWMGGM